MNTSIFPSEPLRKKLAIAGIPESEHGIESLAAKMPDFSSRMLHGLSADMMAELLLYFIAKGIVSLPRPTEMALLDMPWGRMCANSTRARKIS
jgi:hypothetical protein